MIRVDLKSLVARLNPICRRTLEGAAALCLARTNYNVEVEHWLVKLVEGVDTDVAAVLRYFEIDASRVLADLNRVLDGLRTGNSRAPALAPDIVDLVRGAWLVASIDYDAPKARSGHVRLLAGGGGPRGLAVLRSRHRRAEYRPHPLAHDAPGNLHPGPRSNGRGKSDRVDRRVDFQRRF
jgi:hypothetical protein